MLTKAVRASFPEVVSELRAVLGSRLVACLGSVRETRAVPARILREGELEEVGPLVIAAARAFLIGG
jgi:hypothetical protein